MKAAIFQGFGLPFTVETVPDPSPKPNEVLLKVDLCGICGSDISLTSQGEGAAFGPFIEELYRPGAILGHEINGEVIAVGKDVTNLRVGDRHVPMAMSGCGHCLDCMKGKPLWCHASRGFNGGFAQFVCANADFGVKLPPQLTAIEATLVEPIAACLHGAAVAQIKPNDRVVVLGAGLMGLGMAYFARRMGASRIIMVARSTRQAELARLMGADALIPQGENVKEKVLDALGGAPDIVLEAAGAPGIVDLAVDLVRPYGTIVLEGFCGTIEPMPHALALMKELTIKYAIGYDMREFEATAVLLGSHELPIEALVNKVVALDDFPATFEEIRSARTASGARTLVAP